MYNRNFHSSAVVVFFRNEIKKFYKMTNLAKLEEDMSNQKLYSVLNNYTELQSLFFCSY